MNHKYAESGPQTGEDQNAMATDALPDFQGLQKRISAIEMAVKQMNESFKTLEHIEKEVTMHMQTLIEALVMLVLGPYLIRNSCVPFLA